MKNDDSVRAPSVLLSASTQSDEGKTIKYEVLEKGGGIGG